MTPTLLPALRTRRAGWAILAWAIMACGSWACDDTKLADVDPLMQIGIDHLEFGAVAVGDSLSMEVQVQNSGPGALSLAAQVQQAQAGTFVVSTMDEVIEPGAEGRIRVTFSPTAIARFTGSLVVTGNDPLNPRVELSLGGDGYRRGAIEVEPLEINFGTVDSGQASLGQVFVRNVGNGDLLITGIAMGQNTSPDYRIQSSARTPATIPAGTEVPLMLAYRPGLGSLPPAEGALIIEAADPYQPTTTVRLLAGLNQAPLAQAGPDQEVEPLDLVTLDGGASSDPDGDLPLTWDWRLVRRPEGSSSVLEISDQQQITFVPDLVGVYEAELYVTDATGLRSLLPDRVTITSLPAEKLLVELVWDSALADLDLHLLAPGGTLGGLYDCHWDNPGPDWGQSGDPLDDPELKRDDLAGFGPEVIGYSEPLQGQYSLVVQFYASHTPSGKEPTQATLRVFVDGFLDAEITHDFAVQGERWDAATILWPEGTVQVTEGRSDR